ncbi:MAG: hypothetical protein EXQ91_04395 [Alphaproteobacteria bacterium]|nr:hypothetical protein [Alphaproteobacteria bacterium]
MSDINSNQSSSAAMQVIDAGAVVVDAALLVAATYVGEGADLLLIGPDGQQVLIRDHFTSGTPNLVTASGGTRIAGSLATSLGGSDSPGQYAQAQGAGQAQPIGRVETAEGSVTILRADGNRVPTEVRTAIGLVFLDDSTFSLGDSARMVIDELVYAPNAQTGNSVFSVVQGAFIAVAPIQRGVGASIGSGASARRSAAQRGANGARSLQRLLENSSPQSPPRRERTGA